MSEAANAIDQRLKTRVRGHGGAARRRRHVRAAQPRRIGRAAAAARAQPRPAGHERPAAHRLRQPDRALQRHRARHDAQPRAHLHVHAGASAAEEAACARTILAAWRGAPTAVRSTDADLAPILEQYAAGRAKGSFEQRHRARPAADPGQPEVPVPDRGAAAGAAGRRGAVSDIELASRLSFFLWSSRPGRRAAERGRARTS